jgi:hypothetical protein
VQYRERPPHRRYFLLACWEEGRDAHQGVSRWRFSLQDPQTGQRWAFQDLEALWVRLDRQLGGEEPGDEEGEGKPR